MGGQSDLGQGKSPIEFGADVRRARFDQTLYYNVSGQATFDGSTSNSVQYNDNYAGYLLGLADSYTQGSAQRENVRNTGVYLFAQDSWKLRPSITLNYGLRWELDTPSDRCSSPCANVPPGSGHDSVSLRSDAGRAGEFWSQHLRRCRRDAHGSRRFLVTRACPPG